MRIALAMALMLVAGCATEPCLDLAEAACEFHGQDSPICATRLEADESADQSRRKLCRRAGFILRNAPEGKAGEQ